jgi:DNA-binding CsgD family transcriptional regulator
MTSFDTLKNVWNGISAQLMSDQNVEIETGTLPDLQLHSINTSAVTIIDLRTNQYAYLDEDIEKVTRYSAVQMKKEGIKFLFNKVMLSHKFGIFRSAMHQRDFYSALPSDRYNDYILNREICLKDKSGDSCKILHQIIHHFTDDEDKLMGMMVLFTNIDHLKLDQKFNYYIFSKRENRIIHPSKLNAVHVAKFSKRENQIIKLIAEGYSSKEISDQLFISVHTVKTHRKNILRKANVKNMVELIKRYF